MSSSDAIQSHAASFISSLFLVTRGLICRGQTLWEKKVQTDIISSQFTAQHQHKRASVRVTRAIFFRSQLYFGYHLRVCWAPHLLQLSIRHFRRSERILLSFQQTRQNERSMATETEMPQTRARGRSAWSRCDEAVARIAPTSTTTCQVCSQQIKQGDWQLGLMFIHVEGFMLMEWHHLPCISGIPGGSDGLVDVLEAVQNEMTPHQKQQFQQAYHRCVHDATMPTGPVAAVGA